MTAPRKRGRPPKAASERRGRVVKVAVNEAEGAALDALAEHEGRPLADVLRDAGLARARRAAR